MLADRHYMSNPGSHRRWWTSATALVFFANLLVFILQQVNYVYIKSPLEFALMLNSKDFFRGHVWQVLTFQFLHFGSWHFLINALMLYMFGRPVEMAIGRARFFEVYFASGVVGGLLQAALGAVFPDYFGGPVAGASAGVSGLLAVFCLLFRDDTILFMFILPMRAMTLLYVALAAATFFIIVPSEAGVAHAAHLGGMLAAMAYQNWIVRRERRLFDWRPFGELIEARRVRRRSGPILKVRFPRSGRRDGSADDAAGEPNDADFISKEVDPILEKISAHGIQSLTERERRILEAARDKMSRQ